MAIKDLTQVNMHLFICNGGSCKARGAEECTARIRGAIAEHGLSESVHTTKTLCNGRCHDGPLIISQPSGLWFKEILAESAADFVKSYIVEGKVPMDKRLFGYGEDHINSTAVVRTEAQL